tara:strand:- start:1762 stop:2574 length:813 start_codon:yes stop_codon:yes gene_type:complete
MIKKFLQVQKNTDRENDSGVSTFIASTSAVDRYGDIVLNGPENWDLTNYQKNGVVLFNHDQNGLPVGRGEVRLEDGQLLIDVTFDKGQERGAEIARMVKEGFLSAVSVGFQPLEFVERSELPKDHAKHGPIGRMFTKSELLEVSVVTIPAQGQAVAISRNYQDFDRDDLNMMLKDWKQRKAKTRFIASMRKHILRVEEEENAWVVHFAKGEMSEDLEEELEDMAEEAEAEEAQEPEEESYYDKYMASDEDSEEEKDHAEDHAEEEEELEE